MFKSSDIFSFGLILIKIIFNIEEINLYEMNNLDKGEELI